jgi:tetratricopeptide (TPR) repeat protein
MIKMRFSLRSPWYKATFALVCCLCMGVYLRIALQAYLASRLADSLDTANLAKAIHYEPSDAEYYDALGRILVLSVENTGDAIATFRRAVQINPYVASYWLDLAGAYQISGRTQEEQDSVEHAVAADPTTPHVEWEAANFFLIQGSVEKAFPRWRVVLEQDPEAVESALKIAWRSTGDSNVMLERVLPRRSNLYLSFLHLLIERQQTASAENVWNRLIALKQPFSVQLAFPYLQFLLSQKEVLAAQRGWLELASLNPSLAPYLSSPENLIVNPGFEEDLLNGGFDWLYKSLPHLNLAIDTSEFHSGSRSLSATFDGFAVEELGIAQFIPVEPNTEYEFSAECKAEDLDTASGPRFSLTDAYAGTSYALTDDALGTTPWREHRVRFRTSPDTSLVLLKIVRQPASALIRGKFWADDLKLVKASTQA